MDFYGLMIETEKEVNEEGVTFGEWISKVDSILEGMCGATSDDLVDFPSWDMWSSGCSPKEAALECLYEWNDWYHPI